MLRDRWYRAARAAAAALVCACALGGCLSRVLEIRSEPPGAAVFLDGEMIGTTPVTHAFTHYGPRQLVLTHDGYQTLAHTCDLKAPWWACFPCDLFVELWPAGVVDRHATHHELVRTTPATDGINVLRAHMGRTAETLGPERE